MGTLLEGYPPITLTRRAVVRALFEGNPRVNGNLLRPVLGMRENLPAATGLTRMLLAVSPQRIQRVQSPLLVLIGTHLPQITSSA